eukprot:scaffold3924_cov109-Cylindrotheca_fusiformis.AAC.4
MSFNRRLSDLDVRAIFESLHGDHLPPPELKFQIIPVGSNGMRLSPPPYEFPDGLYVLMKPAKRNQPKPRVPRHLLSFLAKDTKEENCPWSLSGPQFPQPTAIQQRYCYPKGNIDYSSQKGGAMWTMYDNSGKEDLNYRLLHVYFSAKRAGFSTPSPGRRRRNATPSSCSSSVSSTSTNRRSVPTSKWPPRPWNPHPPPPPPPPAVPYHPPPMHPYQNHPPPTHYHHSYPPVPHRCGHTFAPSAPPTPHHHHHHHHPYAQLEKQLPAPPSASKHHGTAWLDPPADDAIERLWLRGPTTNARPQELLSEEDETPLEFLPLEDMQQQQQHASWLDNFLLSDSNSIVDDTNHILRKRLESMEQQLVGWIASQPEKEKLHGMVRTWAQNLAREEQTLMESSYSTDANDSTTSSAQV